MSYDRVVSYSFQVGGDWYSITINSELNIWLEELRKNGQEDCHFEGTIFRESTSHEWQWDSVMDDSWNDDPVAILKYVNDNALPESAFE